MRNVTPNVLFSSSLDKDITSAPVFSCSNRNTLASYSATYSSRRSLNPCRFAGGFISTGARGAATERQVCRRRACGARRSAARAAQGAAAAGATAEATMLEPNVRSVDAAGCDWVPAGATEDVMRARTE